MGQKRTVSPNTPIRSFPSPNIDDLIVILDVDSRLPGYEPLEYGTLHPDQTNFPGAKLVYQEPLDGADRFVRRIYASDRRSQEAYNYAIKYASGSIVHPTYIRTYIEPREGYQPLPDGTPDPLFPGAILVGEEVAPAENELRSLYLTVTRVFETLPGPVLTSFDTNEAGQKVTITSQRKSVVGYSLPQASATSSPSAQAEDTGVVVEQIRTVPSIFTRKQYSAERPDMLPQKFRAAVPDVETSELVVGTASQPTLAQGDISASETQQSLFVKQLSRRSRSAPNYPVVITETTATRSGQLATVTSTLDDGTQTADTGPLVESSEVTDLGDGRTIKVTTEVDQVFDEPSFTKAKEDVTPQKFRATTTETVEEQTLSGTAAMPNTLGANELSKTEQQLTTTRKRVQVRRRTDADGQTLQGQTFTTNLGGGTATVVEKFGSLVNITPGFGTVSAEKEALGDGTFVTREIVLASPPELEGQVYDDQLDFVFPFTQQVVPADNPGLGSVRTEIQPQDVHHSVRRELDVDSFRTQALATHWQVPSYVDVRLPDVLESVQVIFAESVSSGGATATGSSWSVSAASSKTVAGDVRSSIRNGYSGPVPATRHIFFVDKDNVTNATILTKTGASNWPAIFTRPETITVAGGALSRQQTKSYSAASANYAGSDSQSESFTADVRVNIVSLPPTLHSEILITQAPTVQMAVNNVTGTTISLAAPTLNGVFSPSSLSPTTPPSFPTGDFLASVDADSYKYGLVRITAVVAHITAPYVS